MAIEVVMDAIQDDAGSEKSRDVVSGFSRCCRLQFRCIVENPEAKIGEGEEDE